MTIVEVSGHLGIILVHGYVRYIILYYLVAVAYLAEKIGGSDNILLSSKRTAHQNENQTVYQCFECERVYLLHNNGFIFKEFGIFVKIS